MSRCAVTTTIGVGPTEELVEASLIAHDARRIGERLDVRIVEAHVRTTLRDAGDDIGRRGVAGITNIRLERDAKDTDLGALDGLAAIVQCVGDQPDHMARHREVDVAGELDEAVDEVELARPPGQVVRVDRDAVARRRRVPG